MKEFDPKEFENSKPTTSWLLKGFAYLFVYGLQITGIAIVITLIYLAWQWMIGVWI